jgi:hypothetical protein
MKKINMEMAASNHNYYEMVVVTYQAALDVCQMVSKAGFVFEKNGNIASIGKLSDGQQKFVAKAANMLLKLHSAYGKSVFENYTKMDTLDEKIQQVAMFASVVSAQIADLS